MEYVLFPDEGHGFLRKENRISASEAFVTFLDRFLKGEGEAAEPMTEASASPVASDG